MAHLENEGYLLRDDSGAYVVGPKLARLGSGIAYHATLRKVSGPITRISRDRMHAFTLATKKAPGAISAPLRHSADILEEEAC